MKPKELFGLLDNKISCEQWLKSTLPELEDYKRAVINKGSIAPVCFPKKNQPYQVKNFQLKRILKYFLDGQLNEIEVSYIASAMTLSEWITFESEKFETFVSWLSAIDPKGSFTKAEIENFIDRL